MSDEAVHNPLQDFHDLLCQLETGVVAPFQCSPLTLVEADNETLLLVRGYLVITNDCGCEVMDHGGAHTLDARIISTTMPDEPGALPTFICEIAFLTISVVIGMGGPSTNG